MNFKYHRAKPYIPDSDKEWILEKYKEILDTGGLIQGKYVSQFEEKVAQYVGTKHAIAVSSCGVGLEIAFNLLSEWKSEGFKGVHIFLMEDVDTACQLIKLSKTL